MMLNQVTWKFAACSLLGALLSALPFRRLLLPSCICGLLLYSPVVCANEISQAYKNSYRPVSGPFSFPALLRPMNILVIGLDQEQKKARFVGARADALMVVSLAPANHRVSVVSIPRDTRVKVGGRNQKINSAYALGGPAFTARTVSSAFGVPIDKYVVFDSVGFRQMWRAAGPIGLKIEKKMRYTDHSGKLYIDLKPGQQKLTPSQVEQYVRYRKDRDADIGRIKRQQHLVRTAFDSLADPMFVLKLPQLVWTAHHQVKTDLSLEEMGRVALFIIGNGRPTLSTFSLPGRAAYIRGVSYWIVDNATARSVFDKACFERKFQTT